MTPRRSCLGLSRRSSPLFSFLPPPPLLRILVEAAGLSPARHAGAALMSGRSILVRFAPLISFRSYYLPFDFFPPFRLWFIQEDGPQRNPSLFFPQRLRKSLAAQVRAPVFPPAVQFRPFFLPYRRPRPLCQTWKLVREKVFVHSFLSSCLIFQSFSQGPPLRLSRGICYFLTFTSFFSFRPSRSVDPIYVFLPKSERVWPAGFHANS